MADMDRREAIRTIAIVVGGATTILALPSGWVKPVVDAVITPANAFILSSATTTTTTTGNHYFTPPPGEILVCRDFASL